MGNGVTLIRHVTMGKRLMEFVSIGGPGDYSYFMAESDSASDDVTALAMGGDKTAVVPQRESWAATWGHAAILIAVGVVAAITIIAIGLATASSDDSRYVPPRSASADDGISWVTSSSTSPVCPSLCNPDQYFLELITMYGLTVTDPAVAAMAGRKACLYIQQGHSPAELYAAIRRDVPSLSTANATALVNASIAAYCPP
ncbi:DUF732 domain-containing protein [Mycobacterium kansasii]|uniref:DUF732 domain-containing protein n=3 Tax=Mycobacterium kansasii TaxID=1768 RepID=UPI0009EF7A4B|nr:hypothetical protein B1T50_04475 [Mycobacterium kansasii]POY10103.1 DUF732 domain-containing protein [Mycobacterium kansasii]POY10106.1 DUF732 domain-containing protein [Mycobacterium kansasii]